MTHYGEFICPLYDLIFNSSGCPAHPPHWYGSVGEPLSIVADTLTMRMVVLGYTVQVAEKNPDQISLKTSKKQDWLYKVRYCCDELHYVYLQD